MKNSLRDLWLLLSVSKNFCMMCVFFDVNVYVEGYASSHFYPIIIAGEFCLFR